MSAAPKPDPAARPGLRARLARLPSIGQGRPFGVALLLCCLVVLLLQPLSVKRVQDAGFDEWQRLFPRQAAIGSVVIVAVDDASIAREGQWPWSRALMAKLVGKIAADKPAVIYSDILWSEPDRMSPANVVREEGDALTPEAKASLATLPDNDALLAASIRQARVTLGSAGLFDDSATGPRLPWPTVLTSGGDPGGAVESYQSALRNLPAIEGAARGHGLMSFAGSPDNVVRQVPLIARVGTQLVPGVALETLRLAANTNIIQAISGKRGLEKINVGPLTIPAQADGTSWVHFGPHDDERFRSAADVLDGKVPADDLADAVVMVGVTGIGLLDKPNTPLGTMPGVEVLAQFIEGALTKDLLFRPDWAIRAEALALLVTGLAMIVVLPLLEMRWQTLLAVAMLAPLPAGSAFLFTRFGLLVDGVTPTLGTALVAVMMTYANYANEEKQKRHVKAAFGRYMSPAMVDIVANNPASMKLGGEKRDMTLLFCDVRGFTTISEMFDAEGLTKLINRFLSPMTELILERKGTIDKYMGDCIMAFWNAPLDDADHAANACRSALAMIERLAPLNEELRKESVAEDRRHVPINIGIGLNSGSVVVGNMGCELRMDYSVLGDTVNTASRLEGQSKTYGVTVVIGESTYLAAPGFACPELDVIQVKGKTSGVRIYGLLGGAELVADAGYQAYLAEHDAMLAAYRAQDWTRARAQSAKARRLGERWHLDHFYDLYDERIADYERDSPGADWDGVYVAKTK